MSAPLDRRLESLDAWDTASRSDRVELCRVLADRLQERHLPVEFDELIDVEPFRPAETLPRLPARKVALFLDRDAKTRFALVPGGEVVQWGEPQREAILDALEAIEAWRGEAGEEPVPRSLDAVAPYGARRFDAQTMFGPGARVKPFLVAARPVSAAMPGLDHLDWKAIRMSSAKKGEEGPLALLSGELRPLLSARGWRLPTRHEAWWMTAPDPSWVFPWGTRLPEWMIAGDLDEHFDDAFPHSAHDAGFERANAFGLVDLLASSYWVQLEDGLGWHGGAAGCYPWQACGEWAGFISRAVAAEPNGDTAEASRFGNRLRPIIPLAID